MDLAGGLYATKNPAHLTSSKVGKIYHQGVAKINRRRAKKNFDNVSQKGL
jgi:hypothetical protein